MIFNIPIKKKFNTWYKKFAFLPTRMTTNHDIVVWLQYYYKIWIRMYYIREDLMAHSSTDSKPVTIDKRMFKVSSTECDYS